MGMVYFGDIAEERRETIKTKTENCPVVGLEHITPGEIKLSNWDVGTDNTFTKFFHKGDILFGRRRAYLKKAAVAPFDGICSGDITTIKAKESEILPELLPFVVQNDAFFDFAVGKSAGSLSPRVKWEHLKTYQLNLPSMDEQKRLAKILMAAEETRQAYKKLITQTDNVIYAELLRNIENENNFVKISDFTKVVTGGTPSTSRKDYWENGTVPWLASGCCQDSIVSETNTYITELGYKNSAAKMMPKHTVMIALTGATAGKVGYLNFEACGNQSITGILPSERVLPVYLFYYMRIQRQKILNDCIGAAQPHISQGYVKNFTVPIIDIKKQEEFVAFAEQAEQTKLAVQQSLDALNETVRALVNRNFN